MTNTPYTPTKEELEKKFERLRKAINFFRENKDKLTAEQWKKYTLATANIVEELIGTLEGFEPDLIQAALEIFPGAKVVERK
jgi:hypothetical protein